MPGRSSGLYVLFDALSPLNNPRIRDILDRELPEQILLDDAESIGWLLTDCVIDYVMGISEQDLGMEPKTIH